MEPGFSCMIIALLCVYRDILIPRSSWKEMVVRVLGEAGGRSREKSE